MGRGWSNNNGKEIIFYVDLGGKDCWSVSLLCNVLFGSLWSCAILRIFARDTCLACWELSKLLLVVSSVIMTMSGKIFLFSRLLCSNLTSGSQRTLCLCVWVLLLEGPKGLQRLWFLQQFVARKRQIRMQKGFASPISHVVSGLVQIPSVENKLLNARTFIYCYYAYFSSQLVLYSC